MNKTNKPKFDFDEIAFNMEHNDPFSQSYLDKKTGDIILITEELNEENCYDDEYIENLPDWEKDFVEDVKNIYEDTENRYLLIPKLESFEMYKFMVDFTYSITNEKLKNKLIDALEGKGAFRRFKNVLNNNLEERELWFKFKDNKIKDYIVEWLESEGIKVK